MLTPRGWAVLGAALALGLLWVLLGETELGTGAILLATAVIVAVAFVAGRHPRLDVWRRTTPANVHEGDHAAVTLTLVNRGHVLRHIAVTDEVTGLGTAEFATAALGRGSETYASYRVLCRPRGVYQVGPSRVKVSDPLGLASTESTVGRTDLLVVYPAVEILEGLPGVPGRNLAVNAPRPEHNQRGGEDFYTLREYQQGDDLRRVHWPSSARRDQLMIRQLETPWQTQAMVILDTRPQSHPDEAAFESAVSGAASVVRHLIHNGLATEVWAGDGPGRPSGGGDTYATAMERLALATLRPGIDLASLAPALRRRGGGGILVLVTGRIDQTLVGLAHSLASSYPTAVLMTTAAAGSPDPYPWEGVIRVAPSPGETWAPAWARAMRSTWHAASVGS